MYNKMGMTRITQYTHRPNATELGMGNTHECYMLVGTDYDMSGIFPPGIDVSIHDALSQKEYTLKSSNYREFRINQMGDIYRDYNVTPGDEIFISQIKKNDVCDLCLTVKKYHRVVLLVKKGLAEIVNIDRLKPYEKGIRKYEVNIYDRGKYNTLQISFDGAKAKRADSPNTTDYYNVNVNGDKMPNGTYYLSLSADKNILANLPKSDFNTIEFDDSKILSMGANVKKTNISAPIQQIYYGAPGTGKSFELKEITKGYSIIRTTFHPDSDYSTFVGAYKPVMTESTVYGPQGEPIKISQGLEKVDLKENRITYTYVKQAFLKAYLGAWQKYAKEGETPEPQFLVIEEINRGNCAQIFGDLFQLLDRNDNGFSTYPIEADSDLQKEIEKAFGKGGEYALEKGLGVNGVVDEYTSNYGGTLSDDIKNGRVLLLPNNLYIWATMNTSDQSLFPIDSAFKRRWDWRYVKIADAHKGWKIKCGDEYCDWWTFVEEINKLIAKETSSDDKKLGYFFCKPTKGSDTITEDKFVGKVLFYLWNDVFKDGDISLFKVSDDEKAEICFDAFYNNDNKVDVAAIRRFLVGVVGDKNLKTEAERETVEQMNDDDEIVEDDDGNTTTSSSRNYDKFTINDGPEFGKNKLALECIREYVRLNPGITAKDVYDVWSTLDIHVSHFIETKEEYDARKDNSKRSQAVECNGTILYVACNGYGSNGMADDLMNSVNEKDWGLTIKKVIK